MPARPGSLSNAAARARAAWIVVPLLACLWAHRSAVASSWNRPAGEGLAIVGDEFESGADGFDGRGRLTPTRSYAKDETSAYVEYGATDWLTLVARPSFDSVHVGEPDAGSHRGLGSTMVGAQWQALVFGPAVLAVQGNFTLPGARPSPNPALVGNTAKEGEARILGGTGLPLPFHPFLDLQASFRVRSSGAASEWHGDATFGLYPTDKLLLLAQSFTAVPTGKGNPLNPSSRSTRLGITGVYALTPAWAFQLGVFTTVLGQDALRARGFTAGVWRYF